MVKILIIDDEQDILDTVSALLKAFIQDCEVLTANSGTSGIEKAKQYRPDTILLDVTMPKMDGFQVCQVLKKEQDTKNIPVIILTGVHTDSKSRIKGLEIGADTFLSKPIKEGELVAHVKAMLRIKRAEDELKKEKELLNFLVRQRTEELDKAKKRYQQLYDFAPDLYFSVRPDGTVFSVNKFGAEYLGYKIDDLVEKPIWDTFYKDDQKKVRNQLSEIFNKKIINSDWEFRQVRKDGSLIWVQEKTHLFLNEKGYAKELLIMCRDVTAQKQAEDAIRESEQHYRTLFEQANDAILLENNKGNIIDFNLLALKALGYTRDELMNMKANDLVEPGNPLFYDDKKYSELKLSEPTIFETQIVHKKGKKISVEVTVTPLSRKKNTFCLLILRDLTERKKIEEEEQKSQKLESIGILAGGIAHDFNNRLSVILGNSQLARMTLKNQGNVDKYLNNIEKGAVLATTLTQQLLTFSRGGTPVKKIHSIKDILKESVELSLSGSKSSCSFHFADNLWAVEVDEGQLIQVINNLIINADQAMADGGRVEVIAENVPKQKKKPHISLSPGDYTRVSIVDHGIGIPPENLDKIFDPYFTTKQKGSGLGLAVAYSIIKKHNGILTAESKLGQGSKFIFYLPAIPEYEMSEDECAERLYKGHGKVLVMDDEDSILSVIENFLTISGYEVELAKDGSEAVELYKNAKDKDESFQIVIMDLTIQGGMGGKETIRQLKEIDPAVKAIVSSGYSNDPIMANYKEYGFNGVIAKPYKMKELSLVLHNILSKT